MGLFEEAARRRRAAELERALAQLDEWDQTHGLGWMPPEQRPTDGDAAWRYHSPDGHVPVRAVAPVHQDRRARAAHRSRRRRGPFVAWLLVPTLAVGAYLYPEQAGIVRDRVDAVVGSVLGAPADQVASGPKSDSVPAAPQQPVDERAADQPADDGGSSVGEPSVAQPPLERPAEPTEPGLGERVLDDLGELVPSMADQPPWGWQPARGQRVLPAVDPGFDGPYVLLGTQPGTSVPVGFSPCGPIEVEVNPDGAPDGYDALVRASLERVTQASGLQPVLVGETTDQWSNTRQSGEPVLIAWSDAAGVPELGGPRAGMGGAAWVSDQRGRRWHSTGQVVLDRDDLQSWEAHSAVLDHELGHVLGLNHVDDPTQLMAATNTGQFSFGAGDLAGLAALGAIPCP